MIEPFLLYDETEQTSIRYVGFSGEKARCDLAIITTAHFFGKKLVCSIHSGCSAILSHQDAGNIPYIMEAFRISNELEAEELSEFLISNL
jgi:hypothetical protein